MINSFAQQTVFTNLIPSRSEQTISSRAGEQKISERGNEWRIVMHQQTFVAPGI
jgi:hypothetical protein